MRAAKISVTVDGATLDEVKRLAGKGVNLSAIFSEALRKHMYRLRLLALLDEMDREDPMTPAGLAAGEKLWQAMQSSSTPGPSRRSPKRKGRRVSRSASQSAKR